MQSSIIQGDCLEVLKQFPDKIFDLLVTDPPYEFLSTEKSLIGGGFFKNSPKYKGGYKEGEESVLSNIHSSFGIKYNPLEFLQLIQTKLKVFNAYIFTNKTLISTYLNFAEQNNYFFDILLWLKKSPMPLNNSHYLIDKEYIIYIRENGATFNSNLGFTNYFTYSFAQSTKKESDHPTAKPLSILEKLIKISSKENDLIIDPYSGSASTYIASIKQGRKCIAIEKNENFYQQSLKRVQFYNNNLF